MRYSRRQMIKQGAALSLTGAAAACSSVPSIPAPAATNAASETQFDLRIKIHGAYGLIMRKNGGLTLASLAHPDSARTAGCDFGDNYAKHEMLMVVTEGAHDAAATTHKPVVTDGVTNWKLTGEVAIKSGATAGGVVLPPESLAIDEFEPFAPSNPANEWAWNDLNYVPFLGDAAPNWKSRAAAIFDLPEGTLRVLPPPNEYGRIGRWRWPNDPNTKKEVYPPRAVSDHVVLEAKVTGVLVLSTPQGDIALSPDEGVLSIEIVSEVKAEQQVIKPGDDLGHLAMLYDFVDSALACGARPVPKYEPIAGRRVPNPNQLTPGVECPLGRIRE